MSEEKQEYKIEGRPATIFRTIKNKENPYVMIDRRPIDNPALSFKAKGILTYLMSRPDGWEVSITDLVNHAQDGEASIRSGLKELREVGHMKYSVSRDAGRITGWLIEVYEVPLIVPQQIVKEHAELIEGSPDGDFQQVEILQVENQDVENRTQVLSTLSNKQLSSKKNIPPQTAPNFSNLSIQEAMTIPELQSFKNATGWFPGSFVYQIVYDAMRSGIDPDKLREAFAAWNARGYNPRNVEGYLEWARNGIPQQGRKATEKVAPEPTGAMLSRVQGALYGNR